MSNDFFHKLKLQFSPIRIADPDFGDMTFMFVLKAPEKSYWEGKWTMPKTGETIEVFLSGDQTGPYQGTRQKVFELPDRVDHIMKAARPILERVFKSHLSQVLPDDIFAAVKLTSFGVDDPKHVPITWDVSFEATGKRWVNISIPFVGDVAQEPEVTT